jgi:predicted neutral ceramidase superfamily lipid hydrolase
VNNFVVTILNLKDHFFLDVIEIQIIKRFLYKKRILFTALFFLWVWHIFQRTACIAYLIRTEKSLDITAVSCTLVIRLGAYSWTWKGSNKVVSILYNDFISLPNPQTCFCAILALLIKHVQLYNFKYHSQQSSNLTNFH